MKRFLLYVLAIIIAGACGQNNADTKEANSKNVQPPQIEEMTVPGVDTLNITDTISLAANENMHFNKELFRVKAGKKLVLIFKNTGADPNMSMAHNVVVLNKGIDIADFADSARNARDQEYIPTSFASSFIAHTKMVIAGKSDTVEFIIPQAGVYDFICSYPGHWGTMQGKIVAE